MKDKSLVNNRTSVQITLPRVAMDYDPVTNTHTWIFSWGEAEKKLMWVNDFMRYNPEKVAESINETLAELCKISVPYKIINSN